MKQGKALIIIICLCAGIAAGLINRFFISGFLYVQGTSMEPSIHNGERVLVNRLHYGLCSPNGEKLLLQWKKPAEGDVVTYQVNGKTVIKRCAATAGTHLEYSVNPQYTLTVGEKKYPLTEVQYHLMYLNPIVPEGTVLCIGDNYEASIDSRNYGFVPTSRITGKIKCR